ncbi:MAG: bifunctional (p)ppGpp synthetase/guanosine-3',5'-bis(diphosphate) 3'-pyrophosphohydrolase [Chloroflexi bacterium]|nr:bifunctional (p)ppGpp synthetase/guanosine-3',5'-bis(diphosphate) 3'-pyrophosphohydrolase [Chloroflexota bacterium]
MSLDQLLVTLPNGETAQRVRHAYQFAEQAHHGRHRASGERYIDHDIAVAQTIQHLGLDLNTIVASLLHDSLLPHTKQTVQNIKTEFGDEVAGLVSGLANLYAYAEKDQYKRYQDSEADTLEGIRRAILAIIEGDIRLMLIRMADCLQDLRKASGLPSQQQREVASEAMNIYAPLANRLGIWQLKWELEDLAFRYLEPKTYKEIAGKLDVRRVERAQYIEEVAGRLRAKINELNIIAEVTGRPKHIYSIHRKMVRKGVDFEEIYDVQAVRVILRPHDLNAYAELSQKEKIEFDRSICYQVLGAVHSLWQPIPREFDDYIAAPKSNGYQSLHTAVIDTGTGLKLEVQIRSQRMHEEAEKGVAAHWAYKEDGARVASSVQRRIQGLRDVLAAYRDGDGSLEDSNLIETEALAERIYVYTPKGDLLDLPAGSTPIDFAYQIHTEVGHRCRGSRVNGKMVSLDYHMKSGDRVEIITAKRGGPSRDWMNPSLDYTGRTRTRSKIRGWFRNQERAQNIQQGRGVVERELRRLNLTDTYTVSDIAKALKYDDEEKFLAKVGFGDIHGTQISGAITLMQNDLKPDDELRPLLRSKPHKAKGLTVQGVSGLATKMAGCCRPIPPESIVGFVTRGQGVTIHRQDCKQIKNISEPERLIEVDWGSDSETFPIPIIIKAYRRPGLIQDIMNILRGQKIVFPRAKANTARSITTVYLEAEVESLDQLNWLLQKLEGLPNVFEAHRQRWN